MTSDHLDARVDSLMAELSQLDGLLGDAEQAGAGLPAGGQLTDVAERLRPVLARMLDPLRTELSRLRGPTEKELAEQWLDVEDAAQRLDAIAAELLPVVEGALARAAGVDRGLCALAQWLLDDLGRITEPWQRVVIPAPREATRTGTWVVGLPLRDATLWSLPLMAHELGHFAVTRLRDQYDQLLGEKLLEGSWRARPGLPDQAKALPGPLPYKLANELFADVFAGYCMGPAYAASLLVRATPAAAWQARQDHPSWGSRVRAVIRTVSELDKRFADFEELAWVTEWLGNDWAAACAAVGSGEPSTVVATAVDAFTDSAIEVMDQTASRARVHGEGVLALGELLRVGTPPASDADLRTVLNAAWAERLRALEGRAAAEDALAGWRPCHHANGHGAR